MRDDHFQKFMTVRQCLLDAEAANPGSPELAALHAAMTDALNSHSQLFTEAQFQPLSGGGKEP